MRPYLLGFAVCGPIEKQLISCFKDQFEDHALRTVAKGKGIFIAYGQGTRFVHLFQTLAFIPNQL